MHLSLSLCRCELFYIYMCMYVDVNLHIWLYNTSACFVHVPFSSMVKFSSIAQFLVSHFSLQVVPSLILLLSGPMTSKDQQRSSFGSTPTFLFPNFERSCLGRLEAERLRLCHLRVGELRHWQAVHARQTWSQKALGSAGPLSGERAAALTSLSPLYSTRAHYAV